MERIKAVACLLTLLLATALFAVSGGAQSLTSGEAKTAETAESGDSLEKDIAKHPLEPGDTFSSPRDMLRSFLLNMNEAYEVLMKAKRENTKAPGLFTPKSVRDKAKQAEELFERAVRFHDVFDERQAHQEEQAG